MQDIRLITKFTTWMTQSSAYAPIAVASIHISCFAVHHHIIGSVAESLVIINTSHAT